MALSRRQEVEIRERDAQVLELRKAGASFAAIARAMEWEAASTAKRAFDRAMLATIQETAAEVRKLELERLDVLLKSVWPAAMRGNVQAIDRCLHIADRRAKLLGLDMPVRTEINVITSDTTERAIAELEARLAENDAAGSGSASGTAAIPAPPATGS